ncbi:hypothetical protein DYG64_12595 [Yersinia enterocolitica]|nr:hypothetical protein [Yersinia enterocolitica]
MRWPRSITRITYQCKLIGKLSFAAFLHLEIYWVYSYRHLSSRRCVGCAQLPESLIKSKSAYRDE